MKILKTLLIGSILFLSATASTLADEPSDLNFRSQPWDATRDAIGGKPFTVPYTEWLEPFVHGNNEEYCEEIYWEDEDNCIDWEDDQEKISQERCKELVFDSTREKCFEMLEEN